MDKAGRLKRRNGCVCVCVQQKELEVEIDKVEGRAKAVRKIRSQMDKIEPETEGAMRKELKIQTMTRVSLLSVFVFALRFKSFQMYCL